MGSLRILIADDNESFRGSLRTFLESVAGWTVCGEAEDGGMAVAKANALHPDVVVLDVSMPGMNGLEAAKLIHGQVPQAEILIISQHRFRGVGEAALEAGARGYVDKAQLSQELIPAIKAAGMHQSVRRSACSMD
jgi:DNA-binding NarL/FixJ family response regulator